MAKTTIKKTGKFTLPSNLSFRRSIDVSDGLLSSVLPDGTLVPVVVEQVTVRGAMGNSTAGYDKRGKPLEGEVLAKAQNPTKPNIQSIDRATLAPQSDTLDLSFSLAFHGGGTEPDACSKPDYRSALRGFIETANDAGLYTELASRYLWNVINGRVLWRNGFGVASGVTLTLCESGHTMAFDWNKLRNRDVFPGIDGLKSALVGQGDVEGLIEEISAALSGARELIAIDVSICVRSYKGAEVWPSQEFVEDSQKKRNGREISRILASRTAHVGGASIRQGVVHSQKLGNAIRTVDEWHGSTLFGAIPVEAFGWVQRELAAVRAPNDKESGVDAYRALENVALIAEGLKSGDEQARLDGLYALAIIVRGGVWGVSEKAVDGEE